MVGVVPIRGARISVVSDATVSTHPSAALDESEGVRVRKLEGRVVRRVAVEVGRAGGRARHRCRVEGDDDVGLGVDVRGHRAVACRVRVGAGVLGREVWVCGQ